MTIDYPAIKNWVLGPVRQRYTHRDTVLYNLGIGANVIAVAEAADLTYVWEERLVASPTMAATLAIEPYWSSDPRTGLDWTHSVHGEQSIEWHSALPSEGEVIGQATVEEVYDKGEGRGALVAMRRTLHDASTGAALATIRQTVFFRNDGGFGGPGGAPKPSQVPDRTPDLILRLTTRPEQALLYRLSGDTFPLHIDPNFARDSGYDRPILHGLCTYGIAGAAIIKALCGGEANRLERLDARFSSPVFPGDTIETWIWILNDREASWSCRVGEKIVIDNGYARLS